MTDRERRLEAAVHAAQTGPVILSSYHQPVPGRKPGEVKRFDRFFAEAQIRPGTRLELVDGTRYTVASDGSLRRPDKPRGTKKERRAMRRAAAPAPTARRP